MKVARYPADAGPGIGQKYGPVPAGRLKYVCAVNYTCRISRLPRIRRPSGTRSLPGKCLSFASIRVHSRLTLKLLLQLKIEESSDRIGSLRIVANKGIRKRRWRIKHVINPECDLTPG
jgi:hypothetical protein